MNVPVVWAMTRAQVEKDRGQRAEDRRQRAEDRGQRTEDRRQRTEDRRQRVGRLATHLHIQTSNLLREKKDSYTSNLLTFQPSAHLHFQTSKLIIEKRVFYFVSSNL